MCSSSSTVFSRILFVVLKMFLTLFMLVLVKGIVSSESGTTPMSCVEIMNNQESNNFTDVLPNGDQILRHCPVAKEYIDCLIRTVSKDGLYFDLDELLSIRSFLEDMCDESSHLHQSYVNHFGCFGSMMDKWEDCKAIASGVIEEFSKSSYAFQSTDLGDIYEAEQEDVNNYRTFAEGHCLLNAHTFACIGMEMQETCGHRAYETFAEIMTRGRFESEFCDDYIVKHFLKGYLDYLSVENKKTESDIIRDLFNVETD